MLLRESVEKLHGQFKSKQIIYLQGPLGSGKTTFVRSFLQRLTGNSNLVVVSPSFSLMNLYKDILIVHLDLYSIKETHDICHLALPYWFDNGYSIFVEWPERYLEDILPGPTWTLDFDSDYGITMKR